jgi:hypothetical protein
LESLFFLVWERLLVFGFVVELLLALRFLALLVFFRLALPPLLRLVLAALRLRLCRIR